MKIRQLEENSVAFDENFKQKLTDVVVFFKANEVYKTDIQNFVDELSKANITATFSQVEQALIDLGYQVEDDDVVLDDEMYSKTNTDSETKSSDEEDYEHEEIRDMATKQATK